jgi:hypothetical protein
MTCRFRKVADCNWLCTQMLALCFLALVVVGVFNTVFSKLQSLPM